MQWLDKLRSAADSGEPIPEDVALALLRSGPYVLPVILCAATKVRERTFGNKVHLCSIVQAQIASRLVLASGSYRGSIA